MKLILNLTMVFACMFLMGVQSAEAGSGKGTGKTDTTVEVSNVNSFMDEDADIRVWLLSENDTPPTTKAEALALDSTSVPAMGFVIFGELESGEYILAAAKESSFQALADDDAFAAGSDFNAAAFSLEDGTTACYEVSSTDDSDVPAVAECAGDDDDGGIGDDGGVDDDGDDGFEM